MTVKKNIDHYLSINLHESMGPGRERTRDPCICSQVRICSLTRYRLRYVYICTKNDFAHMQ